MVESLPKQRPLTCNLRFYTVALQNYTGGLKIDNPRFKNLSNCYKQQDEYKKIFKELNFHSKSDYRDHIQEVKTDSEPQELKQRMDQQRKKRKETIDKQYGLIMKELDDIVNATKHSAFNNEVVTLNFIHVSGHGLTDEQRDPNLVVLSKIPEDENPQLLEFKYINIGAFARKMATFKNSFTIISFGCCREYIKDGQNLQTCLQFKEGYQEKYKEMTQDTKESKQATKDESLVVNKKIQLSSQPMLLGVAVAVYCANEGIVAQDIIDDEIIKTLKEYIQTEDCTWNKFISEKIASARKTELTNLTPDKWPQIPIKGRISDSFFGGQVQHSEIVGGGSIRSSGFNQVFAHLPGQTLSREDSASIDESLAQSQEIDQEIENQREAQINEKKIRYQIDEKSQPVMAKEGCHNHPISLCKGDPFEAWYCSGYYQGESCQGRINFSNSRKRRHYRCFEPWCSFKLCLSCHAYYYEGKNYVFDEQSFVGLDRIYYLQFYKDQNHLMYFDQPKGRWMDLRLDLSGSDQIVQYFTQVVQLNERYVMICGGTDNNDFSGRYLDPPKDFYKIDMSQKKIVSSYELKEKRNHSAIVVVRPLGIIIVAGGENSDQNLFGKTWSDQIEIFDYNKEEIKSEDQLPFFLFGPNMTYANDGGEHLIFLTGYDYIGGVQRLCIGQIRMNDDNEFESIDWDFKEIPSLSVGFSGICYHKNTQGSFVYIVGGIDAQTKDLSCQVLKFNIQTEEFETGLICNDDEIRELRRKYKDDEMAQFEDKIKLRDYFFDNQHVIKGTEAYFVGTNHVYKILLEKGVQLKQFNNLDQWGKIALKGKGQKEITLKCDKQIMP